MSFPNNPCSSQSFPIFAGGPWWPWPWAWGCNTPRASNCPPSPTPPWHRATRSPLVQVVTQNDAINLDVLSTFLSKVKGDPSTPVEVSLPNGNYLGQEKHIYIAGDKVATTEDFHINGTFTGGFTSLWFTSLGFSARLAWDGAGWQLVGGNAELKPDGL